jgi:uncharacterized membrane protein YgdD (TMEM256/DUF423 family)
VDKVFFIIGSILGGIGVAMGAFGAHGLKNFVSSDLLETWDKAVRYQIYHALALFAVSWAITHWSSQAKLLGLGGWLFLGGILIFSGSLYILVLSNTKWLGAITPVGGVAFVAGWFCLFLASWKAD